MFKKLMVVTSLLVVWPTKSLVAQEQRYIEISAPQTVIRFAPDTAAEAIGTAKKGNIFRLADESGDWFEIYMFTGEARYIPKASAVIANYSITLPEPVSRRREIFLALYKVEGKAIDEADRKIPVTTNVDQIKRNIQYQRMLDDRYKLEVMQSFGVQPPIYRRLVAEGVTAGWR